jgi:integrase
LTTPSRHAASALRWRDVDLERQRVRFREKGGKVIAKPIPRDYEAILRAARAADSEYDRDGYVIPMVRRQKRVGDRGDRII